MIHDKLTSAFLLITKPKLIRYALVGGTIAAADIVFFYILCIALDFNYLWVSAINFIIGTYINYRISIRWVFVSGSRFQRHSEITLIYLVSIIALLLSQILIYTFVDLIEINLMASKILTISLMFAWNYLIRRYGIFSPKKTLENKPNASRSADNPSNPATE